MSNNTHKPSAFDYEPVGKVYPADTKIIKHKDGTIALQPSNTNTQKK